MIPAASNPDRSIYVIDDDAAVRDSLQTLLEGAGMAVQTFDSAEAFLARFDGGLSGCIVSDMRMPGMTGIDLQKVLRERSGALPLIVVTAHGDIDTAVMAMKSGAHDFIEKPYKEERLLGAVRDALDLEERQRAARAQASEIAARAATLSQRQRQVMDLVVDGLPNKEIAVRLGISARTVEIYRAWVMERMGARNLAELIRLALQLRAS
ncbi:MAG: response regulator [Alphaproteobacteria bacterium]|nr:response regulator [Alphaproteobacteria bacterium]